jgi:hypothetical protein
VGNTAEWIVKGYAVLLLIPVTLSALLFLLSLPVLLFNPVVALYVFYIVYAMSWLFLPTELTYLASRLFLQSDFTSNFTGTHGAASLYIWIVFSLVTLVYLLLLAHGLWQRKLYARYMVIAASSLGIALGLYVLLQPSVTVEYALANGDPFTYNNLILVPYKMPFLFIGLYLFAFNKHVKAFFTENTKKRVGKA